MAAQIIQRVGMRRREFLKVVTGAAACWPIEARAQQSKAVRRVGVLTGAAGPDSSARLAVFLQALAQFGWIEGQNIRLEIRQGGGSVENIRRYARELAALAPDVIVTI